MKFNKIHIVGAPGSGKTYLARKLAQHYQMLNLDLDNIFWSDATEYYDAQNLPEKRDKLLQEFLKHKRYIIEGVYHHWLANSFAAADIVIILRTNMVKRIYHIIKRYIKRRFNLEHGKKETICSTIKLLRWNWKFDKEQLPLIKEMLRDHPNNVVFYDADAAYKYILQMSELSS